MTPTADKWRVAIPATLDSIELFCAEFRIWHASACAAACAFSTELLLREALTNAVIHGCAEDPGKRVSCQIRSKPGRVVIAVRDEGAGFDWRAVWDHRAESSKPNSRGVEIFRVYANSVRFNAQGNSVVLVKRF